MHLMCLQLHLLVVQEWDMGHPHKVEMRARDDLGKVSQFAHVILEKEHLTFDSLSQKPYT